VAEAVQEQLVLLLQAVVQMAVLVVMALQHLFQVLQFPTVAVAVVMVELALVALVVLVAVALVQTVLQEAQMELLIQAVVLVVEVQPRKK
jgi:hypothetical protein